jgi:hypothetical protein
LKDDSGLSDGSQILNEELKFAKMIIRQQQKFAAAIKKGFITHIKLRGMFEEYDVEEQNIDISFVPPGTFFEMRENQKKQLKVEMYGSVMQTQNISDTFAKKKYLGWRDKEVLADREFRRSDAAFTWELQQISNAGPNWKSQLLAQAGGEAPEAGEAPDFGGGGIPPDFGGGPASVGAEPPPAQEEPFAGEANTEPPPGEGAPA